MDAVRPAAVDGAASHPERDDAAPSGQEFRTAVETVRAVGKNDEVVAKTETEAKSFEDELGLFEDAAVTLEAAAAEASETKAEIALVDDIETSAGQAETARADASASRLADTPAADSYGKTSYVVGAGDSLASIADEFGQSVDDLLLTNPGLSPDARLSEGQTIAVYDAERLEIAREMAATTSPDKLAELVRREILYATNHSSTPQDLLPAVRNEILARRAGDSGFAQIVSKESAWATDLWVRQGRTHAVMDALETLTAQGDSAGLKQALLANLGDTARRSPPAAAVDQQVEILLRYGPQDAAFAEAVQDAAYEFNSGRIERAAEQLAEAYDAGGPIAASALLANLTSPAHFDALSAARLLDRAADTVSRIISHLSVDDHSLDIRQKEAIFGNISRSVEYASSSADAALAIEQIAIEINAQMYTYVQGVLVEGMFTLPGTMLREGGTLELLYRVNAGIFGRSSLISGLVRSYNEATRIAPEEERQISARLFARN